MPFFALVTCSRPCVRSTCSHRREHGSDAGARADQQNHARVPVPIAVVTGSLHKPLDFLLGEVLTAAVMRVGAATSANCSLLRGWRDAARCCIHWGISLDRTESFLITIIPQCQSTFHQRQRDATSSGNRQIQLLRPRRRTHRAPTDRAARFIEDRSHSVSGRFSISATRGQHHVPSSTLSASCVTRKHRAAWR
jgi:hypothetical protein